MSSMKMVARDGFEQNYTRLTVPICAVLRRSGQT